MTGSLKEKKQNKWRLKHKTFMLTTKMLLSIDCIIETKQQKKGKQKRNSTEIDW